MIQIGYQDWLTKYARLVKNGKIEKYEQSTIDQYINSLRSATERIPFGSRPLMEIQDKAEFEKVYEAILSADPSKNSVKATETNDLLEALSNYKRYTQFLTDISTMEIQDFNWVPFFMEFADRLLEYKNDRKTLIEQLISVYQTIGIKFPKIDSTFPPQDTDPFTVFGLFNKGITDTNRIAILRGLAKEFTIKSEVPSSFEGIPVLNNLNASYFKFTDNPDREENDINNLWKAFETAIVLARNETDKSKREFIDAYNVVKDLKGNRWKLSMGFYWIRPYFYINLDGRNRLFLRNSDFSPPEVVDRILQLHNIPDGHNYLEICDACLRAVKSGNYPYKSFPELSFFAWKVEIDAKPEIVVDDVLLDAPTNRHWLVTPSTNWEEYLKREIIGIALDELGDLQGYENKEEIRKEFRKIFSKEGSFKNRAHQAWQFCNEMKPGDILFAKKGLHTIIGRGIVVGEYEFNGQESEGLKNTREVNWTHIGEWEHPAEQAVAKSLTDITPYTQYVERLEALFSQVPGEVDTPPGIDNQIAVYKAEKFLEDVYMNKSDYETLVGLVRNKKNIILQGPPGVGKTYAAKRLAYSMMGLKDQERVMMIQFHQSYSYEDFIMGFRPSESGFELKKGAFYNFCKKAEIDSDNEYFFIIDEINRGNLSKIFGELFMLIESDKRNIPLQLLYSDEKFSVPANVHIIGMMNTADRSLAMLDYALRRRFAFFDMKPAFENEGFQKYRLSIQDERFDRLIDCVQSLNSEIAQDESLGEGFCIGHSYFSNKGKIEVTKDWISRIVEFELIPLLKEYWFDEPNKIKDWSSRLRRAIN